MLILTNDGYLQEELLSEKNHIEKEYLVITKEKIDNQFIKNIQESIEIKGKITKKAKAQFVDDYTFKIILEEGKYHQIRKLVQRESNKVVTLKRIRIGKRSYRRTGRASSKRPSPDEKYLSPTKNILFPIKNIPPGQQAGISARYPYLP